MASEITLLITRITERGRPLMRVLLTGGAGYIGSHTAVELLEHGHDVIVIDNFANSHHESIVRVERITGRSVELHVVDLTDAVATDEVIAGARVDAVVHFGGYKSVGDSIGDPLNYYQNNIGSTIVLLNAMARHRIRKLVFSSSATVYEESSERPIREESRSGLSLANPYGRTKAIIEHILADVAAADPSFEVAILRYFNPVGAHASGLIGEDPRGTPNNLMPYVSQVASGVRDHVSVFGQSYNTPDGTGVRDYIHVMDLAAGHVAALKHLSSGVETYNLGTGLGSSVLDVIRTYADVTGRPVPYRHAPARSGDVASSVADVAKARRKLGWQATRTLEDACRDAWRWQSCNPSGFLVNS